MSAPNPCGAKTRSGSPCKLPAGARTDHPGYGHCKFHGGSSPGGRVNAAKQQARAEAARLGGEVPLDPGEALEWAVHLAAGSAAFFQAKLRELEERGASMEGTGPVALARAMSAEAEKLARVAKIAADAGLEERRLELDELILTRIGTAVQAALAEVGLTAEQEATLREALPRHLATLNDLDLRPARRELGQ